jgi:YD repeat-containing protein
MILRKIFIFLIVFFHLGIIRAQLDTKNIIPLSPNAAAIARYGEVPVSLYSGTPNISIPIYTIGSSKLKLPLQLSYHAGGNKVETIASWVGYGWSMGTIPSISRSVNGIADEGAGGFTNLFGNKTVKQLFEEDRLQNSQVWQSFLNLILLNEVDTEADIFYFNLPGKSGKFFYSQQEQKFLTYPRTEIKIEFINNGISIIDEDGTKYFFGEKESQSNTSYLQSAPVTTTWNITYIKDVNEVETISFEYEQENHLYNTNKGSVRYYHYAGINTSRLNGYTFPISQISSLTQRLKKINFSGGYVQFNPELTPRQDFNGGYALKEIGVYNYANTLVKKFSFRYNILGGGNSGPPQNQQDSKWMFLEAFDEVSNIQATDKLTHSFYYDETIPPNRNSFAQDYWGYYNGANTNPSLIPLTGIQIPNSNTTVMIGDANREINSYYNQFGILKKIVYPTGGSTEFEYESNKLSTDQNNIAYKTATETLEASGQTSNNHLIGDIFTIDNPPNARLNGNNPDGGAFITIEAGYFGCDLSSGASPCANISLNGQTAQNTGLYRPIWANTPGNIANFENVYIPNGTYKLEASFDQNPPSWGNFSAMASWEVIDNTVNEILAPGLRIKTIKSRPDETSNYVEKKFRYLTDYDDPTSHSGKMLNSSNLVYHRNLLAYCEPDEMSNGFVAGNYIKISSYSNYPSVTQNGSIVGYSSVFIENTENGQNGYTQNQFENIADDINDVFPYVPIPSNEHLRGLLKEDKIYKNNGNAFLKLSETSNGFLELSANEIQKGFNLKVTLSFDPPNTIYSGFIVIPDIMEPYEIFSTKSENNNVVNINYDQDNEQKKVIQEINKSFDAKLFKLVSQDITNSKAEIIRENYKYPSDLSSEPIMAEMLQKNMLNSVVEKTSINVTKSNMELSKSKTNYLNWHNNTLIQPSSVQKSLLGNELETEVTINEYDTKGNILQFTGKDAVVTSFVWGYNQLYPVAKVTNSTSANAQSHITQSILNNAVGGSDDPAIRNHLNNLRNIPGAFVTTYTYNPLIGITSETDPNGKTTYYEYDSYNRLSLIRDQDNNILKKICYNYAGQVEECNVPCPSEPIWQNTGNVRCQTNTSCGYTGYQEVEQENVNTCLAPIDNQWVLGPYNPTACATSTLVPLYIQNNAGVTGLMLKLTPPAGSGGGPVSYSIPAVSGPIACVLTGMGKKYGVEITRVSGINTPLIFLSGGSTITGVPAFFNAIFSQSNNTITIDYDY